jgi:hypothetical protein
MMMFYIIIGVSGLIGAGALVGIIFLFLWCGGCYPPKSTPVIPAAVSTTSTKYKPLASNDKNIGSKLIDYTTSPTDPFNPKDLEPIKSQ